MLSIIVKVNSYICNRSYQETNNHTVMQNRLPGVNCRNTNRNWVKQRGKIFSAKNRGEGTWKGTKIWCETHFGRSKIHYLQTKQQRKNYEETKTKYSTKRYPWL